MDDPSSIYLQVYILKLLLGYGSWSSDQHVETIFSDIVLYHLLYYLILVFHGCLYFFGGLILNSLIMHCFYFLFILFIHYPNLAAINKYKYIYFSLRNISVLHKFLQPEAIIFFSSSFAIINDLPYLYFD